MTYVQNNAKESLCLKDPRTARYLAKLKVEGRRVIDTHTFFQLPCQPEYQIEKHPANSPEVLNSTLGLLDIEALTIPNNINQNREVPSVVKENSRILGACLHFNPNEKRRKELGYTSPQELEQIASENKCIVGMKIIPTLTRIRVDSYENDQFLEIASRHGLPVLFHRAGSGKEFDDEKQLEILDDRFPEVPKIGAHFGGLAREREKLSYMRDAVALAEERKNIFLNTTALNPFMELWETDKDTLKREPQQVRPQDYWDEVLEIFRRAALRIPDKIIFGSDLGNLTSAEEWSLWPLYCLNDREAEDKILSTNALKLFRSLKNRS